MKASTRDYHKEFRNLKESWDLLTKWQQRWDRRKPDMKVAVDLRDFYRHLEELERKESKKKIDILVSGVTSSGKSALINSLLRMDILASSIGHCTPGAVSIQPSDTSAAYYQLEDGSKYEINLSSPQSIEEFWNQIDNVSKQRSEDVVRLFVPQRALKNRSILARNVSIIDSPGMERDCFKSAKTKKMVKEADAVVVLIDLISGLNDKETRDLLNNSGFFVKPNVIVLFNKCDKLDDERPARRTKLIEQAQSEATTFLTKDKQHYTQKDEAKSNVFFVSAKEANRAWRSGKELKNTSGASSGVFWDGTRYNSDEATRAAGYRTFEEKLMSIAVDNYESMKAQRMLKAIQQSRTDLEEKALEIQARLEDVNQRVKDLLLVQKACTVLKSEDQRTSMNQARYFYDHKITDGEFSITGEEKVRLFLNFCAGEGSKPVRDMEENICKKVDAQLVDFVRSTYTEQSKAVLHGRNKHYRALFGYNLNPITGYAETSVGASQRALGDMGRRKEAERKRTAEKLLELQRKYKQREEQDSQEIARQRRALSDLETDDLDGMEKAGIGMGAAGATFLLAGPIGWLIAGGVGVAAAAVGVAGREERERKKREYDRKAREINETESSKAWQRKTEMEREQSSIKIDEETALRRLEAEEKDLELRILKGKREEKEKRRTEHIETLACLHRRVMQDIREGVVKAFEEKSVELSKAQRELQRLMKTNAS